MDPIYLLLPGLNNSGPDHWQTHWEKKYGFTRVIQKDWDTPVREDWVATIESEVTKHDPRRIVLIGHSLACCTIAYWAAIHKHHIRGAMLVAPSDTEAPSYPEGTTNFKPMPLMQIHFPTLVVASSDDFYVSLKRARFFATCWGSRFIDAGALGHINATSNIGDWPQGYELLQTL
jgi:uncharacterized protein